MFQGRHFHTIDTKGRLSIPARFRDELAQRGTDTLVLTEGNHCIWAYPEDEWDRLLHEVAQRPQLSPELRNVMRIAVGSAKPCPVDRVGRTLVPPELREFARLDKDVVLMGWIKRFEIWSRQRWNDHYQVWRGDFDERALSEFGL